MREESPLEPCAGCGDARALVAVERFRFGGVRHRIEIHWPHASCGTAGDCGYTLVVEDRLLIGTPESTRTRTSRRRA
jgi:hypothetical protein